MKISRVGRRLCMAQIAIFGQRSAPDKAAGRPQRAYQPPHRFAALQAIGPGAASEGRQGEGPGAKPQYPTRHAVVFR